MTICIRYCSNANEGRRPRSSAAAMALCGCLCRAKVTRDFNSAPTLRPSGAASLVSTGAHLKCQRTEQSSNGAQRWRNNLQVIAFVPTGSRSMGPCRGAWAHKHASSCDREGGRIICDRRHRDSGNWQMRHRESPIAIGIAVVAPVCLERNVPSHKRRSVSRPNTQFS
jgi:hypothetical protein